MKTSLLVVMVKAGRLGDAWLNATYLQQDRWENKLSGWERKERIWRDESHVGEDVNVTVCSVRGRGICAGDKRCMSWWESQQKGEVKETEWELLLHKTAGT